MTRTGSKSNRGEKMTRGNVPASAPKTATPAPAPTPPPPTPAPSPIPEKPDSSDAGKYKKSYAYLGSEYNIFRLMLKQSNIKQSKTQLSRLWGIVKDG